MRMFYLSGRLVQRERESREIVDFQSTVVHLFEQGDEEKRRGIQPQSLMDRSLAHELPKNQVGKLHSAGLKRPIGKTTHPSR